MLLDDIDDIFPARSSTARHLARVRRAARRAADAINLVPSENRMSPSAMSVLDTDFYHRYFFNPSLDPGAWQFRGAQEVADLEQGLARDGLAVMSGATHVNVRPISGMSAMTIALAGLGGPPGSVVACLRASDGGHYATAAVARRLGLTALELGVSAGVVDMSALVTALRRQHVRLLYLDLQNSRHVLDLEPVVAAVRRWSPATRVHVDCSHTLGLVLGGAHPNPLRLGADAIGGSTHKTFPGPHKGVLMTSDEEVAAELARAQLTLLSSHHLAETLALGITVSEFASYGPAYARQTVENARLFAAGLLDAGFDVAREGEHLTDNHQVWLRIGDAAATVDFSDRMYDNGIRLNVQDDLPGMPGPALRLGLNELTLVGGTKRTVEELVQAFRHCRAGDASRLAAAVQDARAAMTRPYFPPLDTDADADGSGARGASGTRETSWRR